MSDSTEGPSSLAEWAEFHEQVAQMPEEEQEAFCLLWYQCLGQEEAADVLGVSLRTMKRRWRDARLWLDESMGGAKFAPVSQWCNSAREWRIGRLGSTGLNFGVSRIVSSRTKRNRGRLCATSPGKKGYD